jgi:outer membrane protein assembly factor BamA
MARRHLTIVALGLPLLLLSMAVPCQAALIQFSGPQDDLADIAAFAGRSVTTIVITGNRVTKEHILLRELVTTVGDPLDLESVREELVRLENLDIVDVTYHVTEFPWLIPYVAMRITDEDGLTIGPALSSANLFGRDIRLAGRALFGGATTYQALLDWPWITGNHLSLAFLGAHQIRDDTVRDFRETSDEITPWLGTWIGRSGRARIGFSWFRMHPSESGVTLAPDGTDDMFRLGFGLGIDTRDSWRNPHRGWENEVQVMRTGGFLGGEGDFWTTDIDLRRYQPMFSDKQTLLLATLATLQTGEVGVDVPGYMQYHLGGSNTIRGYEITELGKELFGKNQLIGTFEYKYLVWPLQEVIVHKWPVNMGVELAAFVDVGVAWTEEHELNAERTKTGFGIGLRLLVPGVETVRFDLGLNPDGDVRFHLATWTKPEAQRFRVR